MITDHQVCSTKGCYPLSTESFRKIKQAVADTSTKNREHGMALCNDNGCLISEGECIGDRCSIQKTSCYLRPGVAGFHTHPYVEIFQNNYRIKPNDTIDQIEDKMTMALGWNPTAPSFADLTTTVSSVSIGKSEGVECIASPHARNMACHALKRTLAPSEVRMVHDAYRQKSGWLGRRGWDSIFGEGSYEKDWEILSKVDVAQDITPTPTPPSPAPMPVVTGQRGRLDARQYRKLVSEHKDQSKNIKWFDSRIKTLEKPFRDDAKRASADLRKQRRNITRDIHMVEKPILAQMRVRTPDRGYSVFEEVERIKNNVSSLRKENHAIIDKLYASVNGSKSMKPKFRAHEYVTVNRCHRPSRHPDYRCVRIRR